MSPIGRRFIDSAGTAGKPRYSEDNRELEPIKRPSRSMRWEVLIEQRAIRVYLPSGPIIIRGKDCHRLASFLYSNKDVLWNG